jgi:hypothetical protein
MVVLLGSVGLAKSSSGRQLKLLVELSTNCCIQYKHAFASFIPTSGNVSPNFSVLLSVEDFVIAPAL